MTNVSETPIPSLQGVTFTDGIVFTFPDVALAAGERLLIVRNESGFEAAYGNGLNVVGTYAGSALDNGGERVILADADGAVIQDFTYSDNAEGWHPKTDGDGYSLVIIDPTGDVANWNNGVAWRPSFEVGGSPGAKDLMAGDVNSDNRVGLVDLALVGANLGTASGAARGDGDLNGDGAVNRLDAAIVVRNLGRFYDPPTPAPAPVTAAVDTAHSEATMTLSIRPGSLRRAFRPAMTRLHRVTRDVPTQVQRHLVASDDLEQQQVSRARRQLRASHRSQRSARDAVFTSLDG